MSFISSYGNPIVPHIYADWTKPAMKRWKEVIKTFSFRLVEAISYVEVKNTTDMALVINAMDLLHGKTVQGFCIVSSDSDYTLLAQRIREEGLLVLGYANRKHWHHCKTAVMSSAFQIRQSPSNRIITRQITS